MSCTPVTPAMFELLETLQGWPEVNVESVRGSPEWVQALAWGWVIESGELTGAGLRHVHDLPRGLLVD